MGRNPDAAAAAESFSGDQHIPAAEGVTVPLFMDVHTMGETLAIDDVANAHAADLKRVLNCALSFVERD
jgi:hypothetical protein